MKRPLVHIGYQKTGTKWLQKHLFANHEIGFESPFIKREILNRIVLAHDFHFDADSATAYMEDSIRTCGPDVVPVLSFERLSGFPHQGRFDSKQIAERLKSVLGGARVLIVIREQTSMILSTYGQFVKGGGPTALQDYVQPHRRGNFWAPIFTLEQFEYHHLIAYYFRLFGRENVLVLPFERFRAEPEEFVRTVVSFSNLDVNSAALNELPYNVPRNVSMSFATIRLYRGYNHLSAPRSSVQAGGLLGQSQWLRRSMTRRMFKTVDKILPTAIRRRSNGSARSYISAVVGQRYRSSNQCVQEMTGLDLRSLGYDI